MSRGKLYWSSLWCFLSNSYTDKKTDITIVYSFCCYWLTWNWMRMPFCIWHEPLNKTTVIYNGLLVEMVNIYMTFCCHVLFNRLSSNATGFIEFQLEVDCFCKVIGITMFCRHGFKIFQENPVCEHSWKIVGITCLRE